MRGRQSVPWTAVNGGQIGPDEHLVRNGSLVRLVDPAAPEIHAQIATLSSAHRRVLAEAILDEAELIGGATDSSIVDRVVAARAAHRVSADVTDEKRLLSLQAVLTLDLEGLGDFGAALGIARAALHDTRWLRVDRQGQEARDVLEAAVIRLSTISPQDGDDPLVQAAVARAMAGGASVRLEAQVWAAVNLLSQPGRREAGLRLADTIAEELQVRDDLGPAADSWRILLAFHVGRAGHPQLVQQLVAPLLTGRGPDDRSDTARQVLFAVAGPGADTRLQIILLQAELDGIPEDAIEDRLRLHHALGAGYARIGDYQHALPHARQEYPLRADRQGPDHPNTLGTRNNIAAWTGRCGDTREALRLYRELLPDQQRVLGPDHPDTLNTRNNIAAWTGTVRGSAGGAAPVPGVAARPAAGPRPRPPRHPDHPRQHRRLDRRVRGSAGGAAPVPGVAARPAAGPRPRPPRHPDHPQQHRRLDRTAAGIRGRRCACPGSCCPTSSGSSAPTTPTP